MASVLCLNVRRLIQQNGQQSDKCNFADDAKIAKGWKNTCAAQRPKYYLCFTHSVGPGPQTEALCVMVDSVLPLLVFNQLKSSPLPCVSELPGLLSPVEKLARKVSPWLRLGRLEAPSFLVFFVFFFLWGRAEQISIELFPTLSKTSVFPLCATLIQNRRTDEKWRFKVLSQKGFFPPFFLFFFFAGCSCRV